MYHAKDESILSTFLSCQKLGEERASCVVGDLFWSPAMTWQRLLSEMVEAVRGRGARWEVCETPVVEARLPVVHFGSLACGCTRPGKRVHAARRA